MAELLCNNSKRCSCPRRREVMIEAELISQASNKSIEQAYRVKVLVLMDLGKCKLILIGTSA